MNDDFQYALQRLDQVTGYAPQGSGYRRKARCPAHDDRAPSMTVGLDEKDQVWFNCHRNPGCTQDEIRHALGLPPMPTRRTTPGLGGRGSRDDFVPCRREGHKKVDEYDYHDEQWNILFGVARCDHKCFPGWQPDPTAPFGRRWNHDGVRIVPYRLPEILAAVQQERVVMITEGEKDANALRARPLITATCNPGGSGRGWPADFARYFSGADVTIVADRDEAGRRHAQAIVDNLMPVARSLYVTQARHGKDAADHLAAGGTTGDFITVWEPKPYVLEPSG
ncbi:hypothetical protein [Acrocarpospora sp. B8E8]|uniref:hypothetical protein n=1 Tax=Acrocarpospora sp. B8E8 TaxID=3153572 RepID=UPI00325CAF1C